MKIACNARVDSDIRGRSWTTYFWAWEMPESIQTGVIGPEQPTAGHDMCFVIRGFKIVQDAWQDTGSWQELNNSRAI